MKPLICKQCGGQIDPTTYICRSCGTAYERPQAPVHMIKAVHEDPRFATISASVQIADDLLCFRGDPTEVAKMAIEDLTHQLAEAIVPFVEMRTERGPIDPLARRRTLTGTVRVRKPEGNSIADGVWLEGFWC